MGYQNNERENAQPITQDETNYVKEVLLSFDCMGNALAGGNHENTISSRTGHFARKAKYYARWYWLMLEFVIDVTFFPFDGWGHCQQANERENDEIFTHKRKGGLVFFGFITVSGCLILIIPFYIFHVLRWAIKKARKN